MSGLGVVWHSLTNSLKWRFVCSGCKSHYLGSVHFCVGLHEIVLETCASSLYCVLCCA